ncbi:FAD-dependent oxidoreductase [Chondromyces crocatus]|uniref:MnmG N-terminal domain-containing protein n=1 Tax=Chondromyces crocatus TaxID=52 RepID=A0A0K1E5T4_CHOCO|nr:FAD-dependent oxidoreductase [Chondromyces crocatus]AKT36235.1 uncharacterized protein CMC5_003490 [Chondromyces crocatus]
MPRSVIVIGSGAAGTAAAWRAQRLGCEVTMVSSGAGASALTSGAIDDVPWEQQARAARLLGVETLAAMPALPAPLVDWLEALGAWRVPASHGCLLATLAGRLRPARGHDSALLDLAATGGGRVLIPRASRADWDADALSDALNDDPRAKKMKLHFEAIDVPVLRFEDERRIADADLAVRHDHQDRRAWLAAGLRHALTQHGAVAAFLLGPWLGTRPGHAQEITREVGVPVGEALSGANSPAGLRFEISRDTQLTSVGVERVRRRVREVTAGSSRSSGHTAGFDVRLEGLDAPLHADAVVLATGGVLGGGVLYTPPEHGAGPDMPPGGRLPFALSFAAPVQLGDGHGPLEVVSSLFGPALDAIGWPSKDRQGLLEAVGVLCQGVHAAPRLLVAGDAIAARPRTLLEAAATGLRAGTEAASG